MTYIDEIRQFQPSDEREAQDQSILFAFIEQHRETVLLRQNSIAHITSSGLILNEDKNKVLLIHHNIRNVWAWTGGHADGEPDLLAVAIREAKEESGVTAIRALSERIASVDILPVYPHFRRGSYVNGHLHLSVAYLLVCDETASLSHNPAEASAAAWFPIDYFTDSHFDETDVYLYNKLIRRALS
ncbi:MAG: NUDIX hydrolase [Anaerofustis sp.]